MTKFGLDYFLWQPLLQICLTEEGLQHVEPLQGLRPNLMITLNISLARYFTLHFHQLSTQLKDDGHTSTTITSEFIRDHGPKAITVKLATTLTRKGLT